MKLFFSIIGKLTFRISILTICVFVGNFYFIVLNILYDRSYPQETLWLILNLTFLTILMIYMLYKFRISFQDLNAVAFMGVIIFPILWLIFPLKFQSNYTGLRKEENSIIVKDVYCSDKCSEIEELKRIGYYVERKYYSWKYAEVLNRHPPSNDCCYKLPFDSKYFFTLFMIMEITFEYLPIIIFLAISILTVELIRKKELKVITSDLFKKDFSIRKINILGLVILLLLVAYNSFYIYAINNI